MMEILCTITIVAIISFGALFILSVTPRFEKSKAYLLPIICSGILFAWSVLAISFFSGEESSNFYNLSSDFLTQVLLFGGAIALIGGLLVGSSINLGSDFWIRKEVFSGIMFIGLSLVLWVISVLWMFYILAMWATG